MNSYIVFIKDNESKVVVEGLVTRDLVKELKGEGFTQYPYAIEASDEAEARRKLNKQGEEHLNTLSEYSGNVFFYCAILVVSLMVAAVFTYY